MVATRTPFRWRVLLALADSLAKITTANGYYSMPPRVEVKSLRLDQTVANQTIYVEPVSGSLRPRVLHDQLDRDHRMVVEIGAFIVGTAITPFFLGLFQMEEDIARRLYEDDPTLGGLVKTIERPEEDLYRLEGVGATDAGWLVKSVVIHADEGTGEWSIA